MELHEGVGYAKLVGTSFEFLMQKTSVIFGHTSVRFSTKVDVDYGDCPSVTRIHATLSFNTRSRRFELEVNARAGVYINDQLFCLGAPPVPLDSNDTIRFPCQCTAPHSTNTPALLRFLLPRDSPDRGPPPAAEFTGWTLAWTASERDRLQRAISFFGMFRPLQVKNESHITRRSAAEIDLFSRMMLLQILKNVSDVERQSAIQALPPGFTDESQLPSFAAETTLMQWPKLARCASSWLRRIRQLHLLFELVVHCADVAKSDSSSAESDILYLLQPSQRVGSAGVTAAFLNSPANSSSTSVRMQMIHSIPSVGWTDEDDRCLLQSAFRSGLNNLNQNRNVYGKTIGAENQPMLTEYPLIRLIARTNYSAAVPTTPAAAVSTAQPSSPEKDYDDDADDDKGGRSVSLDIPYWPSHDALMRRFKFLMDSMRRNLELQLTKSDDVDLHDDVNDDNSSTVLHQENQLTDARTAAAAQSLLHRLDANQIRSMHQTKRSAFLDTVGLSLNFHSSDPAGRSIRGAFVAAVVADGIRMIDGHVVWNLVRSRLGDAALGVPDSLLENWLFDFLSELDRRSDCTSLCALVFPQHSALPQSHSIWCVCVDCQQQPVSLPDGLLKQTRSVIAEAVSDVSQTVAPEPSLFSIPHLPALRLLHRVESTTDLYLPAGISESAVHARLHLMLLLRCIISSVSSKQLLDSAPAAHASIPWWKRGITDYQLLKAFEQHSLDFYACWRDRSVGVAARLNVDVSWLNGSSSAAASVDQRAVESWFDRLSLPEDQQSLDSSLHVTTSMLLRRLIELVVCFATAMPPSDCIQIPESPVDADLLTAVACLPESDSKVLLQTWQQRRVDFRVPCLFRLGSEFVLPQRVSPTLTVLSLGRYSSGSLVDFVSLRTFASARRAGALIQYRCEVRSQRPFFRVISSDGDVAQGNTPTEAWNYHYRRILQCGFPVQLVSLFPCAPAFAEHLTSQSHSSTLLDGDGQRLFGLFEPSVVAMLQSLPGAPEQLVNRVVNVRIIDVEVDDQTDTDAVPDSKRARLAI